MWRRSHPYWFSLPVVISLTPLLLASAYGSASRPPYESKGENGTSEIGGGAPDATYESLREILSNENVDDQQRTEMDVSGLTGVASQVVNETAFFSKAVATLSTDTQQITNLVGILSNAAEPLSIDFQRVTDSIVFSPNIEESQRVGPRSSIGATNIPLGIEMAAAKLPTQAQDTSSVVVTSTAGVSTTARSYYCLSPSIPSDVMILPAEDQFWEVGSTQSMSCLTDPASGLTSSDISLSLGFHGDPIPHQIVDNYTIAATVNIAGPGNYKLCCATKFSPPKVCMRTINVGYPPLDVNDLECKSWNWNVLECRWRIPTNPAQEPADDYQIHLVNNDGPPFRDSECQCDGGPGRCGSRSEGCLKTCCSWIQPSYLPASRFLSINVTAVNPLGSTSFVHRIDNWNSVVPDEAEKVVTTTTDGSLEVRVKWDMPIYIGTLAVYYGVHHAVEYRPNPTTYGETPWILGSSDICRGSQCNASICVEHPGATYEIRVRLRVNRTNFTFEDDGWWSKWTAVRCDVPAQRPWTPPSTSAGTFQVRNGDGQRDVSVSWRPLPLLQHNGPNFTYIVNASIDGESLSYSEVAGTFVTYRNISDNSHLSVNVMSANNAGVSNTSASVRVLPATLMPAAPVLQVVVYHASPQQYEVTWHELGNTSKNYAVYVCIDNLDSKDPCKGDLYWMDVGNVTSVNLTLNDFGLDHLDNKDLRFAVSSESYDARFSSGMSWDGCYHPQTYRKTTTPPMLSSSIPVTSTSANVSWTLDCENRAGVVEGVLAEWCQGHHNFSTCNDTKKINQTDVVSGLVILKDLEPNAEYIVRLRIQYRQGLSGWSIFRTFKTSRTVQPVMATWLIATIASVCIAVAVSIFFCFSYSRMKVKEFLVVVKKPINVPKGITSDIMPKSPDQKMSEVETSTAVAVDASSGTQDDETKHPEETETLIKQSGAKENGLVPSPQHSGMVPVPQGSRGYIQADFPPETTHGYSAIERRDLALPSPDQPRRAPGESDVPSRNIYMSIDNGGIGGMGYPGGMSKDGEKAQMLELSDFRLPSSGYTSVLHHPGLANVNENGYLESDFLHESTASANVVLPVVEEEVPGDVNPTDCTFNSYPDSSLPGIGRGYIQLDVTHANILPPELLQQFSHHSGFGEEQQAHSNSDESLATAPKKESLKERTPSDGFEECQQQAKETLFKRNENGYVDNPLFPEDVQCYLFQGNENGYVQHPLSQEDIEGVLPVSVNAYVDSKDCFPSGLILQVDSTSDIEKADMGIKSKDSLEYNAAGYVKTEISYENGITIKANKDTTTALSVVMAREMENALSYVMMPELTSDGGNKNSQDDEGHTSAELLCKSIDLGEGGHLLNGYIDGLKRKEKLKVGSEIEGDPTAHSHGTSTDDHPIGYCRIGDGGW